MGLRYTINFLYGLCISQDIYLRILKFQQSGPYKITDYQKIGSQVKNLVRKKLWLEHGLL